MSQEHVSLLETEQFLEGAVRNWINVEFDRDGLNDVRVALERFRAAMIEQSGIGALTAALIAARSMLKHMAEMSNYLALPGSDVRMEFDDHIYQIDKALARAGVVA